MEEEKTNASLKEMMEELIKINKEAITKKKEKKFRLPWKARVGKAAMKKNYSTVLYINDNKEVNFVKVPIESGTIMIKDSPYVATADYMLTFKGRPFIIIPSWNTEPFSIANNLESAERNKTLNIGYKLLLNRMKMEVISTKKKMSWTVLLIGGAVLIGVIYLLQSGTLKL